MNEHFFDIIDTEEKAYFLGFIYGDGYNCESKKCIKIRLHNRDEELLLKFITVLYPNNDKCLYYYQKNKETYCELVIESKHMSQVLKEYGCIQNKSKNIYYPNCIPENLTNHFIRGVFDADGTISYFRLKSGKEKGTLKACFSIIGYIKFIEQIQEKMILNIDIKKNKLIKSKAKDIYSLMYSGIKQTIKIMDWIYKDSTIFLERKHKKYLELKEYLLSTKSNIKPDIFCHICNCNLKNRKTYEHDEKVYCYKCFSSFNINREKIRKRKNIKDYNVEYNRYNNYLYIQRYNLLYFFFF